MKRIVISSLGCCILFSSVCTAQEGLTSKSLWPFGGRKAVAAPTFDGPPALKPLPRASEDGTTMLGMLSPRKMLNGMQKQTDAVFDKTKSTLKNVQDFGKGLLPFDQSPPKPKQPKRRSFFSALLPKPKPKNPATVNEFLSLPRPDF